MIFNKLISVAAAVAVGSMTLHAAPDNMKRNDDQHQERSGSQGKASSQDRSYSQGKSSGQDRSYNQGRSNSQDRTGNQEKSSGKNTVKGEIRREEVRKSEPQKYTPHPVKAPPSSHTVRKNNLPPAFDKKGTIVRTERSKHYYRPPGARPLPYYHRPGYVVHTLPRLAITLTVGGLLFYYADGIYYRHATSGFIVAVPPAGLIVTTLPVGYTVFVLGGMTYYYYADVYYVWDSYRGGYRVVEAPLDTAGYRPGDVVEILPDGAISVTINGRQYYRYNNVYFMQAIQNNGIVYIVVNP